MSRRDDINNLYRPSKILERVCLVLFVADVALSFFMVVFSDSCRSVLTVFLVVIAFLYMVLSVIDDGVLWYRAESARRKNGIQEAFSISLSEYSTEGYYNNDINDPELSYAANLFESCFFTREISRKMLLVSIIKSLLAIVVLILACRFVLNDDIFLVIAQTVFSATLVEETIRLVIYVYRICALYDYAYHEFVTVGITRNDQRVSLRWFCLEYESVKAHYRVRLDEYIFKKYNLYLSHKWDSISSQIKTRSK